MESIIIATVLVAVVCGSLGYAVADQNDRVMGLVLGLILGPIGVLIAAVTRKK